MIYTFRAKSAESAAHVRAIAYPSAKTFDQWFEDGNWWIKVWTEDRSLPHKVRRCASLERREW
ncbi:MAG: hypothetical protein D6694_09200 [Gammaproteobacteria bacterium]|nr:MAG: hypothetical protein D6694_09200 [Gammaproteobacteria bacterium]